MVGYSVVTEREAERKRTKFGDEESNLDGQGQNLSTCRWSIPDHAGTPVPVRKPAWFLGFLRVFMRQNKKKGRRGVPGRPFIEPVRFASSHLFRCPEENRRRRHTRSR